MPRSKLRLKQLAKARAARISIRNKTQSLETKSATTTATTATTLTTTNVPSDSDHSQPKSSSKRSLAMASSWLSLPNKRISDGLDGVPFTKVTKRVHDGPTTLASKPSFIIRHERDDKTDEGTERNTSPITDLSEADFNSLVELIKSQRCCSCSGSNLLLQLEGSSKETGISPELLNRIGAAILS